MAVNYSLPLLAVAAPALVLRLSSSLGFSLGFFFSFLFSFLNGSSFLKQEFFSLRLNEGHSSQR